MKKQRVVLSLVMLFLASQSIDASDPLFGLETLQDEEADLLRDDYKKAIKRQKARYGIGGTLAGAAGSTVGGWTLGTGLGALIAKKRGEKLLQDAGQGGKEFSPGGKAGLLIGSGTGALAGFFGTREGVAQFYAKKYKVGRNVALAAHVANQTLENPKVKELLVAAEKKDDAVLKSVLGRYYAHYFGSEWRELVPKLLANVLYLDKAKKMYGRFVQKKEYGRFSKNIMKKIKSTLPLTYAASLLYFDRFFFALPQITDYSMVRGTQKLFNTLFGG